MPSIFNDAISQTFFFLSLLTAMVAVPWVGAAIEDIFYPHKHDDDDMPDGFA